MPTIVYLHEYINYDMDKDKFNINATYSYVYSTFPD